MRVRFYQPERRFADDPQACLHGLASQAFEQGERVAWLVEDAAAAAALDKRLWELPPDSFIPHQIAGQDDDAHCPVLIVPAPLTLARISHTPPAADADFDAVARRAPSARLDVVSATPAPFSSPRAAPRRHLGALATYRYEKCGLGDRSVLINQRRMAVSDPATTVIELIPADPAGVKAARERWRDYQARGLTPELIKL